MECPVRKVTLAHVELRGLKEQRVPQDHKVQLGQKVQPGQQDLAELLARLVPKDHRLPSSSISFGFR